MEGYQTIKENADVYLAQINQLTERITSDLGKNLSSADIQKVVKEMDDMVKEHHKIPTMDMGENYWILMADLHLTNPTYIKINDKKYGKGTSKFIGESLKFYNENSK